nr:putative ribonuclease h protein [Quercus suber]
MEAKIPANSSYAWKSIMKGRNVIKRGAKWRIGSGRSVPIWGENWLPSSCHPKVLLPRAEGRGVRLVADLVDPDIKEWKVNVIDNLFYDFEATLIKNMPLCRSIQDDVLIWPFNPDGVYSVKSGYRYLHEQQQHGLPGPSDISVLTPLWKKIWGLQVPNKVKHLAWKACKDSLPTKTNLIRRKVITEGCCDVCKLHQEDVVHALFLCPALQPVWRSRAHWNHSTLQACSSFTDIFELIFVGNREPDLFAAVLWTLWNRRNNLRLGKPALSLGQVVEFAQDRLLERASCSVGFHQTRPHQVAAWQAPVQDTYKVNFDGTQIPLPGSVIEVEVLAARKALELTLELGFDNITLEGDSEVLIKSLAKGGNSLAHYGHLLADIHMLMARFSSLSLSHVKRHCNSLAHALARRASSTLDLSIWMEEIPPDLNSVYMADLSGLS